MVSLSANLECMSEMCCKRLAEKTGCKTDAKNRPLGTIAQLCRAISSQLRHESTIGKNCEAEISPPHALSSYNTVNFGPLAAEIVSLVWGKIANFNGFRVLASLLQRRRSTKANQTLHNVWPSPARLHYTYIFGGCCPVPCAKFTLRPPSLALSYWRRYCTALEQWARAKLCGVEHRAPPIFGRATITLGTGPYSSCNL